MISLMCTVGWMRLDLNTGTLPGLALPRRKCVPEATTSVRQPRDCRILLSITTCLSSQHGVNGPLVLQTSLASKYELPDIDVLMLCEAVF